MAITPADLPPEFGTVPEAIALLWIAVAEATVERGRWSCAGVDPDLGVKMLAAHLIKLDKASGLPAAAGTVASKSIGGVSVSKVVSSAAAGKHGSTTYGQAYDALYDAVDKAPRRHLPPSPQPAG